MTLDQLMDLPQAGAAALAAHRWLGTRQDVAGINAFDLLACLARATAQADAPDVLSAVAACDEKAAVMWLGFSALHEFERAAALAQSLGIRFDFGFVLNGGVQ